MENRCRLILLPLFLLDFVHQFDPLWSLVGLSKADIALVDHNRTEVDFSKSLMIRHLSINSSSLESDRSSSSPHFVRGKFNRICFVFCRPKLHSAMIRVWIWSGSLRVRSHLYWTKSVSMYFWLQWWWRSRTRWWDCDDLSKSMSIKWSSVYCLLWTIRSENRFHTWRRILIADEDDRF